MENGSICSTWLASGWWALALFLCFAVLGDSAQVLGRAAGQTHCHWPTALIFSQTKLCLPSASQSCLLHVCRAQKPGLGKTKGPRKHSSNRVSNPRSPSYSQCWIRLFPYVSGLCSPSLRTSLDFRQTKARKGFASHQAGIIARWPHLPAGHTSGKWQDLLKWDVILSRESGSHACVTSIRIEGRLAGSWYLYLWMYWAVLISRQEVYWSSLHRAQGRGGACVDYIGFLKDCLSS